MKIYESLHEFADAPPSVLGLAKWTGVVDARTLGSEDWPRLNTVWELLRSGEVHEPEFEVFRHYSDASMFLDVGANCGQSIASFRAVNRTTKITSFEPSQFAFPIAALFASEVGAEIHNHGVGQSEETLDIFLPLIDGLIVTPLASTKPEIFAEGTNTRNFIHGFSEGREFSLVKSSMKIAPVGIPETFELCKVDVEGAELEVMRALSRKLEANKPLIVVEKGPSKGGFEVISQLGYDGYRFELKQAHKGYQTGFSTILHPLNVGALELDALPINIVYLHPSKKEDARSRGIYFNL